MNHLCQQVQCSTECPDDSYLPSAKDEFMAIESDGSGVRQRRAIAMNNHPQESIKIVPSAAMFFTHNQLQPALPQRHFWKRSLASGVDLQDRCCPKCVCRPCPSPRCPPNFIPAVSSGENGHRAQPGNCCPDVYCQVLLQPIKRCYSKTIPGRSYTEGEEWNEDRCTHCKCEDGESRCQMPTCRPLSCARKRSPPDQCCDVCDEEGSIFCRGHVNCPISCRHGYQRQGSCYLCQCALPASNGTIVPPPSSSPPSPTAADSTEAVHHNPAGSVPMEHEKRLDDNDDEKENDEKGLDIIGGSSAPPSTPVETPNDIVRYVYFILLTLITCGTLLAFVMCCIKKRRSCRGKYSTVPLSTSTITPTTTSAVTTTPTLIAPIKVNSSVV
uniref:Putative extracellular matrix protein fras1 n=1 Tax=Anopheles darlingi TaxID=43151 RepID=A0A2M4CJR5_ANODA